MRAQLLHLSGALRGQTITYPQDSIVLGSAASSDARVGDAPAVAPRHAEISFHLAECVFYLRRLDGPVFVNGREIEEVILEEHDLVELGADGPKARFAVQYEPGNVCKPVHRMLGDAREVGRTSGVLASLQSFTRDLFTHATVRLKIGFPLVAIACLLAAAFLGGWLGGRAPASRLESGAQMTNRELVELRGQLDALSRREMPVTKEEIATLRADLAKRAEIVDRVVREHDALKRVLEVYSRSVCLIHGSVHFQRLRDGALETLRGDDGKSLEFEFVGSGFLANERGTVITNHHVAEPWWGNEAIAPIVSLGYTPRFARLEAIFPGRPPAPIDPASIRLRADAVDVAAMRVDAPGVPIPPLFTGDPHTLRGQRVVVLGYPTGLGALLAKVDPAVAKELTSKSKDMTELIAGLAARDAIFPVATQGALNDVLEKQLVYDASTTSGGSGGPVFGVDGEVIGVNFAVLSGFTGSNFGVPISFARELLP